MTIYNIPISKLNVTLTFDTDVIPDSSVDRATEYGLKQFLNDKHASVKRKDFTSDDEFLAEVKKVVDKAELQIRNGEMPSGRPQVDPIAAIAAAMGLTTDEVKKRLAAQSVADVAADLSNAA